MGQWRQARAPRRRLAVDDVMSRIPGGETLREAAADYGSRISEVTALPELATERHFGDSNLVRRISRLSAELVLGFQLGSSLPGRRLVSCSLARGIADSARCLFPDRCRHCWCRRRVYGWKSLCGLALRASPESS